MHRYVADDRYGSLIGIDTGKNTLHLVGLDERGMIVLREKLDRSRIRSRLANVPHCLIGIEAGMARHWRSAAKMLSNDEAQRIAVNIAKLLDLAKY